MTTHEYLKPMPWCILSPADTAKVIEKERGGPEMAAPQLGLQPLCDALAPARKQRDRGRARQNDVSWLPTYAGIAR